MTNKLKFQCSKKQLAQTSCSQLDCLVKGLSIIVALASIIVVSKFLFGIPVHHLCYDNHSAA